MSASPTTTTVTPRRWTPALVAGRLTEAADVLDRLPEARVSGMYSLWPLLKVATRLNVSAEQKRPNIKTLNKPGLDVLQEH